VFSPPSKRACCPPPTPPPRSCVFFPPGGSRRLVAFTTPPLSIVPFLPCMPPPFSPPPRKFCAGLLQTPGFPSTHFISPFSPRDFYRPRGSTRLPPGKLSHVEGSFPIPRREFLYPIYFSCVEEVPAIRVCSNPPLQERTFPFFFLLSCPPLLQTHSVRGDEAQEEEVGIRPEGFGRRD